MLITVRLFAGAAQLAKASEIALDFDQDHQALAAVSVRDVARQLVSRFPPLQDLVQASRWAVADEFVELDFQVRAEHTLVMIPPVSGG